MPKLFCKCGNSDSLILHVGWWLVGACTYRVNKCLIRVHINSNIGRREILLIAEWVDLFSIQECAVGCALGSTNRYLHFVPFRIKICGNWI